jgi:hypothetical protein
MISSANDAFYLKGIGNTQAVIRVRDISGRIVYEAPASDGFPVQSQSLIPGIYIVEVLEETILTKIRAVKL